MGRTDVTLARLAGGALVVGAFLSVGALGVAAADPAFNLAKTKAEYARPKDGVPMPDDNKLTPVRVELGRKLFFDPRLSGTGSKSCATCHNPSFGWQDGLAKGIGRDDHQLGRATPTILDLAWGGPFFWDGRAVTLEQQAVMPIASQAEMNLPHDEAVTRVAALDGYRSAFAEAYPGEKITIDTIGKALASYERTIVSADAPFDKWIKGKANAISPAAQRGFVLYNTKARCGICHSSWRFTDDGFHDIGVGAADRGRAAVTSVGIVQLENAFKTPTLRNIDQRAPYMHDGSAATLEDVVDFYDKGEHHRDSIAPEIEPLNLTAAEKSDLIAFLHTLTSEDPAQSIPLLPR